MSSKLHIPAQGVLKIEKDFSLENQAVGTVELSELPAGFVIQSISHQIIGTLTAGATLTIGDTADADGYSANIIAGQVDGAVVQEVGAYLYNAADDYFIQKQVSDESLKIVVGGATIVAGKLVLYIQGYQAY